MDDRILIEQYEHVHKKPENQLHIHCHNQNRVSSVGINLSLHTQITGKNYKTNTLDLNGLLKLLGGLDNKSRIDFVFRNNIVETMQKVNS